MINNNKIRLRIDMNRVMKMKNWQLFIILSVSLIVSVVIGYVEINIGNLEYIKSATVFREIGMIIYLSWLLVLGLSLNSVKSNPHKFRSGLFVFFGITSILGYTDLNLDALMDDRNSIPEIISMLLTLLTFIGIIYIFYNVPKSLKSIEVGEQVKFKDCIVELILLIIFPIGVWILQPRFNRISQVADELV